MAGFVLKDPTFTLGGTDYTGQITRARLVPEVSRQTGRTLDPLKNYQDVDEPVWTLQLTLYQDTTATGLSRFLEENHGLSLAAVLAPKQGTGNRSAAFNIMGQTVDFGGERGEWALAEVELGVIDQPVWSDII